MNTTKKVAIIGLGNIGKVVAKNLVKGNRPVIIAGHKPEAAQAYAQELGTLATATETVEAIKQADIVILSVWFSTIKEFMKEYANELQGKIIVDPSNPMHRRKTVVSKKSLARRKVPDKSFQVCYPTAPNWQKHWVP